MFDYDLDIALFRYKIVKIEKTLPNLAIPEMIDGRVYRYTYPVDKIKSTEEEILKRCEELTGTYDVSEFTDKKGQKLKEKIITLSRSCNVNVGVAVI